MVGKPTLPLLYHEWVGNQTLLCCHTQLRCNKYQAEETPPNYHLLTGLGSTKLRWSDHVLCTIILPEF